MLRSNHDSLAKKLFRKNIFIRSVLRSPYWKNPTLENKRFYRTMEHMR